MVTPGAKREAVAHAREHHGVSERRACALVGVSRRVIRYEPTRSDDGALRQRLRELAAERRRFGYRRLGYLLAREGILVPLAASCTLHDGAAGQSWQHVSEHPEHLVHIGWAGPLGASCPIKNNSTRSLGNCRIRDPFLLEYHYASNR